MVQEELKELLEFKYDQFNRPEFIEEDPISVPHMFSGRRDIEIAGILAATIAWGSRKTIVKNARQLVQRLEYNPYEFLINAGDQELTSFHNFVHRTFNGVDCIFFLQALRRIYLEMPSLEEAFFPASGADENIRNAISRFRAIMLRIPHQKRSEKHLADPMKNASAKRINMFLRWMVRNDGRGVDFGIWKNITPAELIIPLDLHTGNVARKLGMLGRKANDWKAAEELTDMLRTMDPSDPVKYDFALFGLGIFDRL
jgi:uncharacterized protein (TIGR02757 family)